MDFFKIDLFQSEIFVFTPKGDLIQLPKGSSVLDFAFSLHTDLGYQCIAGKIDGKAYPINTVLKSGVTIEILRAKFQHPSPSWLNWVKTSKAKRDIRSWLKQKSFEHTALLGKELFEREIMRLGIQEDVTQKLYKLFPHFKMPDLEQFYHAVGNGDLPILVVLDRMFPDRKILQSRKSSLFKKLMPKRKKTVSRAGLIINAPDNIAIHFGKCCQPLPGDKIVGYIVKNRGIEIHRNPCTRGMMLMDRDGQKIEVSWEPTADHAFKIKIQVLAGNRMYLLSDITRVISGADTNILHAHVRQHKAFTYITFILELRNRHHLNQVYRGLRKVKDIRKISREAIFKENVETE
jgi:GTP pyrophosphokinase